MNNFERGNVGNYLVFHDLENESYGLRGWFYFIVKWFQQNGLMPSKLGVTIEGDKDRRKTLSLKYGSSLLEKHNFEGVKGILMAALPPDVHIEMFDTLFDAQFDLGIRGSTLVMCFIGDILKFSRKCLRQLSKDIASFLRPKYGYAYQREFTKGPSFYPFGVIVGTDERAERQAITKWGNYYRYDDSPYKIGDLRAIYPMNLLSQAHLKQAVF